MQGRFSDPEFIRKLVKSQATRARPVDGKMTDLHHGGVFQDAMTYYPDFYAKPYNLAWLWSPDGVNLMPTGTFGKVKTSRVTSVQQGGLTREDRRTTANIDHLAIYTRESKGKDAYQEARHMSKVRLRTGVRRSAFT